MLIIYIFDTNNHPLLTNTELCRNHWSLKMMFLKGNGKMMVTEFRLDSCAEEAGARNFIKTSRLNQWRPPRNKQNFSKSQKGVFMVGKYSR